MPFHWQVVIVEVVQAIHHLPHIRSRQRELLIALTAMEVLFSIHMMATTIIVRIVAELVPLQYLLEVVIHHLREVVRALIAVVLNLLAP